MSQYIRVTKAGIDALGTANEIGDYIFHSDYNTFKIISSGTTSGTIASSSTGTLNVAHGLSFTPPVTGFIRDNNGTTVVGSSGSVPFLKGNFSLSSTYADGTNVYFVIKNDGATNSGTFLAKFYAFEVPLA